MLEKLQSIGIIDIILIFISRINTRKVSKMICSVLRLLENEKIIDKSFFKYVR